MDDATPKAAEGAGKDSAPEADMTEEQLWKELEQEDKGTEKAGDEEPPADEEPTGEKDEPEGWPDEPPPDEDDDQGASEADDGADDGQATASDGMDPEALRAQNERLQQAFRSEQGRAKALQRKIQTLQRQVSAAEKSPQQDRDEATLEDRRKKLEEAREEYGDVIGPLADHIKDLEERVEGMSAREKADLEQQRAELNELYEAEERTFQEEHPDGFDVVDKNREAFAAWIEDQPKALRDIYAENQQAIVNGTAAAYLVGQFKEALLSADGGSAPASQETQRLQHRRQRQLAGARSERTPTRQAASSRPAKDSDDPQAHWDYFERLEGKR